MENENKEEKRKLKEKKGEKFFQERFKVLQKEVLLCLSKNDRRHATEILAVNIQNEYKFYTTRHDERSEMWIYLDGIYRPMGRSFVKEFCRKALEKAYTTQLANAVISKVEADTYIDINEFFDDKHPTKIATNKGILDVVTREYEFFDPKYIFFSKIDVTYSPSAECPVIENFLNDILPTKNDIELLLEFFASCLIKEQKFEKALMLVGKGRNGKGKVLSFLRNFLGVENCVAIPMQKFADDQWATGELLHKMANIGADISASSIYDTSTFKSITGRDMISADRKFLPKVNFIPYTKHIFSCNSLPYIGDSTDGFWERWLLLEFPYQFVDQSIYNQLNEEEREFKKIKDVDILQKIDTPEERSGFLNLLLDSLERLITNGEFTASMRAQEIKKKWERGANSLKAFIEDRCEVKLGEIIPRSFFKEEYIKYCEKHNIRPLHEKAISMTMSELGVIKDRRMVDGDQKHVWDGIKIIKTQMTIEIEGNLGW